MGFSRGAGTLITNTNAHVNADPGWVAMQVIEDCVATFVSSTITANGVASNSTTHSSVVIPAGVVIAGVITSITLASGTVLAISE
jgi:hypothetical protein